ncbi:hydantoinase B/oxoprolinase family protein [Streptomyces shenzhenensis]|uniref:5-oxoprolinase n=1 Tax=Streptomyces shenzhenensis TaxID=943815 RepID=A0A3M0I394_9ACTN|nr:hydantoinase B/oxoprolinase family protein [Streptomyces shenzhenensis]RMB82650.1 5-oxoprolinase [Streptomyces shenzhenensis]
MTAPVSPVVVEVVRNAFNSAAEEMSVSLFRGAHTPVIYEAKDCAVGLYDADARLLGQAPGLPIFLGNIQACIQHVTAKIGLDGYADGDVFVLNDAYIQGSHLTDITVLAPIFVDGALVAFAATRADGGHLGGKDLGVSTGTRHIYEEGLRIPPVRLVKAGVPDEEIFDLLSLNSFFHSARRGDLEAQIAACYKGAERIRAIYRKFGRPVVEAATADIFRQSEELDRRAVAAIPDGTYTASGLIDDDGVSGTPVRVQATVRVAGDEITVDLTGSSPATPGPVNSGRVQAISACRVAFKELINPEAPVTGGNFRNLSVVIPEGSVFDAHEPSPVQWYYTPLGLLIDLVQQALAPVLPERVAAAHFGDSMIVSFVGTARDGAGAEDFVLIDAETGGWGAFHDGDGQDAMINVINGDFKNLPIEFVENKFPITVESYGLRQDSEGAGRFRGGLGVHKTFRVEQEGTALSLWLDRSVTPAWGLFGGHEATGPVAIVAPGTPDERRLNKITDLRLPAGRSVQILTGGGGGYGDPHDRDREHVARDVTDGYISARRAEEVYGLDASQAVTTTD